MIKITKDKRGKESAEFVSINAYAETDDSYYVSQDNLSVGDTIQMPDSSEQYSLKDTAKRKGVYNMDKGYAIFRQIESYPTMRNIPLCRVEQNLVFLCMTILH